MTQVSLALLSLLRLEFLRIHPSNVTLRPASTRLRHPLALCTSCLTYCFGSRDALGTTLLDYKCSFIPPSGKMQCDCCSQKPTPPPPPPCSPPPPSGGQCDTGDDVTETRFQAQIASIVQIGAAKIVRS
ncbi:uncharacterized protein LOC113326580 [Papaver somniferum]|uniref:uncharacterized protein LOC113326580 n=1 Tax=Papaver somniferum TaxID=3469 RepID=UPI000E70234F|nr:uncharacterized protein LOC113326580 [Papaver somniferum]